MEFIKHMAAEMVVVSGQNIEQVAAKLELAPTQVSRYVSEYKEMMELETLENAYMVLIEMHVGNDTRHLTQMIYARSKQEANEKMEALKPDYRGNETPSYSLQIKGGPFKLTENHRMLKEY